MRPTSIHATSVLAVDLPSSTHGLQSQKKRLFSSRLLCALGAAALVSVVGSSEAKGAVIFSQGFEAIAPSNEWGYTLSGGTMTTNDVNNTQFSFGVSAVTGSTDTPGTQRILPGILPTDSVQSFQVRNSSGALTFDAVNVSLYSDLYIIVRLSATSATTGNGLDGPDYVRVFTAIDGAAFKINTTANADISLAGNGNARWGYDASLTLSTAAGMNKVAAAPQIGSSTNNYSTLRIDLNDSTSTIAMRLNLFNDTQGEYWNIDGIELHGTLVPEPSRAVLLMVGVAGLMLRRKRSWA